MAPEAVATASVLAIVVGLVLAIFCQRPGWGFVLVMAALTVPVFSAVADDVLDASRAIALEWWTGLPLLHQVLAAAGGVTFAVFALILIVLGMLRILAWPFIGRRAADGLVAGLGVEAFRLLFIGLFRSVFGLAIRLVRRR